MYICLCEAITDKQIRNAARKYQVTSLKGLRQILPVGLECGKCIRQTKAILYEEQMIFEDACAAEVA
ncbi:MULTISPECIES: bacterioferritin-associated ferredoxin [Providencia]|uniref:Bacterioferritin-associated ferredoxin n=1 Tax=Providencia rettgeri TaxID=587 RepID=A0AB35LFQ7_PRORE|nr:MULTISPECIES: bacterioferritin-associated ferredoxin [Providencia]EHZ7764096.1 bacterioferritin-associated ferredoxin [Providencia rettgeri]EIJ7167238.1 bacterioferritin-associated ferredoxin [Providencia rettgeri]EJD6049358.1 bacterioferritin-associated ferredoxin [Providencia rettgeri]EJD6477804.1 bacterioferritin-associated ferredoxin [Providencia rettgeri]EKT59528.1 bacterioferritin-associated ferredoxin [Providencia rettgeri Dmel1]